MKVLLIKEPAQAAAAAVAVTIVAGMKVLHML
jgi:hypothetical protein